eukprot:EG_transcript_9356
MKAHAAYKEQGAEVLRHAHFNAFFASEFPLRHSLHPKVSLANAVKLVCDGLHKMVSSRPWFALQFHVKAHATLRKYAKRHILATMQRDALLDNWLEAWQVAEANSQQKYRKQLESQATLTERLRGQEHVVARAITPIADGIKVQVLWELYWLLRHQYRRRWAEFLQQWRCLLARRRELMKAQELNGVETSPRDFWEGEPQSLRALDAAIFACALQEPQFKHAVGHSSDVKVYELLRLANANLEEGTWTLDRPLGLGHATPTMMAFLASPLCTDEAWMRGQYAKRVFRIPVRTWRIEESDPANCRASPRRVPSIPRHHNPRHSIVRSSPRPRPCCVATPPHGAPREEDGEPDAPSPAGSIGSDGGLEGPSPARFDSQPLLRESRHRRSLNICRGSLNGSSLPAMQLLFKDNRETRVSVTAIYHPTQPATCDTPLGIQLSPKALLSPTHPTSPSRRSVCTTPPNVSPTRSRHRCPLPALPPRSGTPRAADPPPQTQRGARPAGRPH